MTQGENITVYLQDIKWNEPSITLQIEPEYTSLDVVKLLVNKTRQFNHNSYELAEIFVSSGQLCKERRLDMAEIPYNVQGLWPKGGALAPDATYRFYLVRKGGPGGFLRSLSWTDCPHSVDVPLDSYLIKFLEQKTAGENYADLCSLPDLNETTLLDNLKQRFYSDTIYTYVGTILIVINPFKFFPIYNPKYVTMYQDSGYRIGELPPHIFAIANAAFTSMLDTQSDQCIVISGESGSGKTENTNFLLHHLTQNKQGQQQQQSHHGSGVEQTLLGAGPVLEAFGNAKTVHNDNSSRFGKFIQVDFRKNGVVHGASVEKYLLEKSRIVSQATNERNYHVFYYLLSGAPTELAKELFLLKTEEYQYLNQSGCYTSAGVDEVHEFERLKRSMDMVGFKSDLQKRIFAVISAILLLGNVEFAKKHTYHHDDAVQVKNSELVSKICRLLDVKEESFLEALTSKRTIAGGETVVVRYKLEDAISARNAMAKCLYGAIFDWMVWQINHSLFQKQDHKDIKSNSIGVLDIFGFEDFYKNSFEQFCINYANEHLQYYFNQHIFKFEQEEYRREKIDWQNISFIDNRRCLDLFAKRPSGLFFLLDEEGNFPGATNDTLLEKFHQNHKNSDFYEVPMRRESTFTIKHYAGKVKYHVRDFREKNSDLIHADLVSVLKNSNSGFVRELVGCDPVAMLRWSYVRLCMKCVNAFVQAGKAFHNRGGNKIGNIRRKTSVVTQKHMTREHTNLPWSDNSETESGDHGIDDTDSFIHKTAKKAKRKHSKRRQKYKDYKQFKTYQEVKNRETSKTKTPSVSLQFQKSLQSLLETLDRSHPYFVRCIKSNMDKVPCKFDDKLVCRQLQYTGMLATVKLRQSGYNYRVLFEDFVVNYAALLPKGLKSTREDVDSLLTAMDGNHSYKSYQVGKTKNYQIGTKQVFLRETVKMLLDDALHHALMRHILRIQSWVRTVLSRSRYLTMREAAIAIQKTYRGALARKITGPALQAHREAEQRRVDEERKLAMKLRQEAEEERRRSIEIEELERRRKLEAEERERRRRLEEEAELEKQRLLREEVEARQKSIEQMEEKQRAKAAVDIQRWYKKNKAIMDARVKQRALALPEEMSQRDSLPVTDIDQLSKSMDEEAFHTELPSPDKSNNVIESWLDKKSPSINGHSSTSERSSSLADKSSELSNDTSDRQKEEMDEVRSIEPPGDTGQVQRRASTSINRTRAFRNSTKDSDRKIPVVDKRAPPSPSISSTEDSDNIHSPTRDTTSLPLPARPYTNNDIERQAQPVKHSDDSVIVSSWAEGRATSRRTQPRVVSDNSELKEKKAPPPPIAIRPKPPEMLRSEKLFYSPETKPPELRNSFPSRPSSVNIESPRDQRKSITTPVPDIVISRKVPDNLPLEPRSDIQSNRQNSNKSASSAEKSPVRRTSSNDPGILLRRSPKSERTPDLHSPDNFLSPTDEAFTRQSSRASSTECEDYSFTRTHILRKNVQVRKSQSADNLAPAALAAILKEHEINMKHGHKANGPHANTQKSYSHDHLAKSGFEDSGSKLDQSNIKFRGMQRQPSDDSDLGGAFESVTLPPIRDLAVPKIKDTSRSGRKKSFSKQGGTSQWTVSSTSEWNYPDDLAITESEEISEINRFIYDKYLEFRGNHEDECEIKSVYDRVFRDAMKEMYNMLITKSALSMGNPNSFHPLKFRDLMSNFRDYVTAQVAKNVTKEQAKDFPTPIAINAFRGYLDEYQKKRRHIKRKAPKPKPKEHKKKPPKNIMKLMGHHMLATQFTMPTFCEVCNKMMFWNIRVPGLECENCKFSCHKKCSSQINANCQNQPADELSPNAVFGVPLISICTDDSSVPPVLDKLIAELDNRGVYTAGIYRKSGIAHKVRALKKALDTDWEAVNLSDYAIHVLSLTLKTFFRELPDPLFTFDLYDEFIRCPDIANNDEAISAMRATVEKLPAVNHSVISRLMVHLARIAQNEPTNRMSPNALAIVFAPGLLRTSKQMTAQESLAQVGKQCRAVELMLNATLRKLNSTLDDINQLESEEQTLEDRLSDVRQSMRKHSTPKRPPVAKRPPSLHVHAEMETGDSDTASMFDVVSVVSDTHSTASGTPVDMEMAEEEEKQISAKIKHVQERKDRLKSTIPRLTLTHSDGDDGMSADDIESSAESLDDIED